jgi:hypothetical protein
MLRPPCKFQNVTCSRVHPDRLLPKQADHFRQIAQKQKTRIAGKGVMAAHKYFHAQHFFL